MFHMPAVHSPHSTVEISKSSFCQETDDDAIEYESAEEMMEEVEEETDIQNKTDLELDITESSGMRYDGDETHVEEEKPDGYMVMVCWIGLAYTGIHSLCSSKA